MYPTYKRTTTTTTTDVCLSIVYSVHDLFWTFTKYTESIILILNIGYNYDAIKLAHSTSNGQIFDFFPSKQFTHMYNIGALF